MVIDNQLKAKVWQICRNVFGKNAEGIYGESSSMDYGDEYEVEFITNLNEGLVSDRTDTIYAWGASKLVLIPSNENFVIKVDIDGICQYDEDDDKFNLTDLVNEHDRALPEEVRLYNKASSELKQVLVPVHYLFDYNRKIPVYVQEKYNMSIGDAFEYEEYNDPFYDSDDNKTAIPKSLNNKLETLSDICYLRRHQYLIYDKWIKRFGFSTSVKIAKELQFYSDLHNGNIAFMKDGSIKICDYAGYNHDSHWDSVGNSCSYRSSSDSSDYNSSDRRS